MWLLFDYLDEPADLLEVVSVEGMFALVMLACIALMLCLSEVAHDIIGHEDNLLLFA